MSDLAPMRLVLEYESHGRHVLDCGHRRDFRYTAYGPTYPAKSRCGACARKEPLVFTDADMTRYRAAAPLGAAVAFPRLHNAFADRRRIAP